MSKRDLLKAVIALCLFLAIVGNTFAKDYKWEFNKDGETEGWKLSGLDNKGVTGGTLKTVATRGNPMMFSSPVEIDAANQTVVSFRMKLGKGILSKGCLLFTTDTQPQYKDNTIVSFGCNSSGKFHDYEIDMSKNPLWKGKILSIRFQPFSVRWPLPEEQRTVEIDYFRVLNFAAVTGAYGFQAKPTSSSAVTVTFTNTMPVQYIRIENRGDVEFSEVEAYDANKTNVALKKPVKVSTLAWGNGSLGNDGINSKDNHVMMRTKTGNWWEVDLGKEMPLTHVIIHERPAQYCEKYRPLDGATFSILDSTWHRVRWRRKLPLI